jgi:hypothetical protein
MDLVRIIAVPLLAELLGRLVMMVVLFSDLGSGFDFVIFASEQQKICLSLFKSLVSSNSFALSLRPLTLSVEIVIRFLREDDGLRGELLEEGDIGIGDEERVLLVGLCAKD